MNIYELKSYSMVNTKTNYAEQNNCFSLQLNSVTSYFFGVIAPNHACTDSTALKVAYRDRK